MAKLLVILALIIGSKPVVVSAQPVCSRQWVCIEVQENDNKINFRFTNRRPYAVSITLHSYGNNVRPNTDFITSFTLNGQETRRALALTVIDPKKEPGTTAMNTTGWSAAWRLSTMIAIYTVCPLLRRNVTRYCRG